MTPFVVFSLKRSGSTSLMRALNALPGVRCLREPFNPRNYDGRYHRRVAGGEAVEAVMRELRAGADGIKHVWEADGWPFADAPDANLRVALAPGQRVVFLRRRNVLRRAVSLQMSEQSDVWSMIPTLDRERLAAFTFAPVSAEAVRRHVASESAMLDGVRDRLAAAGAEFVEVWYEDLYDEAAPPAARRDRLEAVLAFLGLAAATDDGARARIARLLDPAATRLNSAESYGRVPAIRSIEAELGADATGWLFR
jgi:LPS sulfotransferase NodH